MSRAELAEEAVVAHEGMSIYHPVEPLELDETLVPWSKPGERKPLHLDVEVALAVGLGVGFREFSAQVDPILQSD
jgi:hypothetical protein